MTIFERILEAFTRQNTVITSISNKLQELEIGKGGGVGMVDDTEGYEHHGEIFNTYEGQNKNKATNTAAHTEGTGSWAQAVASHAEGTGTIASGQSSHSEGDHTTASGHWSHSEGYGNVASGAYAHAEGYTTTASGGGAHTEGFSTVASEGNAHAEGASTEATGYCCHSEGIASVAAGNASHAEGEHCTASGYQCHAEGSYTTAGGSRAHAEGESTIASNWGHAEGKETKAVGSYSHAGGYESEVTSTYGFVHGYDNFINNADAAHVVGGHNCAGPIAPNKIYDMHNAYTGLTSVGSSAFWAHAEGEYNRAWGTAVHVEGEYNVAYGTDSHAEGHLNIIGGYNQSPDVQAVYASTLDPDHNNMIPTYCHAEGSENNVTGYASHVEGDHALVHGNAAHGEGYHTQAFNDYAHAEGSYTHALGNTSHAEGESTYANGLRSHAEGQSTHAVGDVSHAEGVNTTVSGNYSHAEGSATICESNYAHVEGDRNKIIGNYAHYQHAEGQQNLIFANGNGGYSDQAHVEGSNCIIGQVPSDYMNQIRDINNAYTGLTSVGGSGPACHAEGNDNRCWAYYSHVEGSWNVLQGQDANHVEGYHNVLAAGSTPDGTAVCDSSLYPLNRNDTPYYSHVEGYYNHATGTGTHCEGHQNHAHGQWVHCEGHGNYASGQCSHTEGMNNENHGYCSHVEGSDDTLSGNYAHVEGYTNTSCGDYSHIEGYTNTIEKNHTTEVHNDPVHTTKGDYTHIEGRNNTAKGCIDSHLEGNGHTVYGEAVHVEGKNNTVGTEGEWIEAQTRPDQTVIAAHWGEDAGAFSHVEGKDNVTTSDAIHCEGIGNTVKGVLAHCEGQNNLVGNPLPGWLGGRYSHCEGTDNVCSNDWCHVEGGHNQTTADYQHVCGKYNAPDYYAMMMIGNGRIESTIIVPTWQANTYYTKSGSSYTLQSSKPGDWDTFFYRYYYKEGNEYFAVPMETTDVEKRMNIFAIDDLGNLNCGQSDETGSFVRIVAPTWQANTYYTRGGTYPNYTYTLQTSKPANWDEYYMYYFYKDGNEYYNVPVGTEGMYGLVNGVDLQQLRKDVDRILAHLGI